MKTGVITGLTELGKTLNDFVIPRTINGEIVTQIADSAFEFKANIKSVVIPASVIEIGENAFNNCNYLSLNCEVAEKPSGWHNSWNPSSRPVTWGYNN